MMERKLLQEAPQIPFGRKSAFSPKGSRIGSGLKYCPCARAVKSQNNVLALSMHHRPQQVKFELYFMEHRLRCGCKKTLESLLFQEKNVKLDFITQR